MTYYIDTKNHTKEEIISILNDNKNIRFVSFVTVDLANNRTDERIPIDLFIKNYDNFMKKGIQTDGSSVSLPKIADINNGKVDIIPDRDVKWVVDYSRTYCDDNNKNIGTLLVPSFLVHDGIRVGSRGVLYRAVSALERFIIKLLNDDKYKKIMALSDDEKIEKVNLTTATELEFWVYSPYVTKDEESLFVSQELKEQYWKRPHGQLRKAMEESMSELKKCGFKPEMAHKEVGGVVSSLNGSNDYSHMEQVEIDWKYDNAIQSLDNEWIAKDIISDVFASNGLDVTFKAKPIDGVAGSGEHHHIGITVKTNKRVLNLFSPNEMKKDFLNRFGYGALMGILKNYDLINPFISSNNDSFNRLKPGFEAPVCTTCSLGHSPAIPSRNRTILIALIRDLDNILATRFELRSPNPGSNSYLTVASSVACMIEGINYSKDISEEQLLKEVSKKYGEDSDYLLKDREYRCEKNLFKDYSEEERNQLFSKAPQSVYENILKFNMSNTELLRQNDIFTEKIIDSYIVSIHNAWLTELTGRIIPNTIEVLRKMVPLHQKELFSQLDKVRWKSIYSDIMNIMKDSFESKSLITKIYEAIDKEDYNSVSNLQLELSRKVIEVKKDYLLYKRNIIG